MSRIRRAMRHRGVAATAIVLAVFLAACDKKPTVHARTTATTSTAPTSTTVASTTSTSTTVATVAPVVTTTAPAVSAARRLPAGDDVSVARQIDGDTVEVTRGIKVRFIGMDTPEKFGTVECYGIEASRYTASLIPVGTRLRLVYDVERLDRYGRTLAYLYRVSDGLFINAALVRDGYAQVYTYPPNVAHVDDFVALQREARAANRGLWAACGGAGGPAPTSPPQTAPAPPAASGGCDSSYPDFCIPPAPPDLNCKDVAPHRNFTVRPPDAHGFDADHDGKGCES
jgi:micrococcal nuclease